MKKILLFAFVFLGYFQINAQNCTTNTSFTNPGYYPDALPPAKINVAYSQDVTVVTPADTTIELIPGVPITLPIDSIVVTSITNLPAGFTYKCDPPSCGFPGGTANCMNISGNPVTGAGSYNLIINVRAYSAAAGALSPLDETINFGQFVIEPDVSVVENYAQRFSVVSISPQPAKSNAQITLTAPKNGELQISVFNIIGERVYQQNQQVQKGQNNLFFQPEVSAGLYLLHFSLNGLNITEKFVVTH